MQAQIIPFRYESIPHIKSVVEAAQAFDDALAAGRLSKDTALGNYCGDYMFMGVSQSGKSLFKHIITRQYLD